MSQVKTSKIPVGVLGSVKQKCAEVVSAFPAITHVWGYATTPDHNNRRCIDFMVPSISAGDRVVAYLIAHKTRLGVQGIIWNRRVMGFPENGSGYRGPSGTWRPYNGASPHRDHPHVQFSDSRYVSPGSTGGLGSITTDFDRIVGMYKNKKDFEDSMRNVIRGELFNPAIPDRKGTGNAWGNSLLHNAAQAVSNTNKILPVLAELAIRQGFDATEVAEALAELLDIENAVIDAGGGEILAAQVADEIARRLTE